MFQCNTIFKCQIILFLGASNLLELPLVIFVGIYLLGGYIKHLKEIKIAVPFIDTSLWYSFVKASMLTETVVTIHTILSYFLLCRSRKSLIISK